MERWGRINTVWAVMAVATAFVAGTAGATVSINVGSTSGAPGATVTFQVMLASGGAQVGGVQNVIEFNPATPISSCAVLPLFVAPGWSFRPSGCTPLVDCRQANFVLLSKSLGSVIPDGLLYQCDVKISDNAPGGIVPLRCSGALASDTGAVLLPVQCVDGHVEVLGPTPSPTAALTATLSATPTASFTPTLLPIPTASFSPIPPATLTASLTPTPVPGWSEGGGCQLDSGNRGSSSWCWLAAGTMLLWRWRPRRQSLTTGK